MTTELISRGLAAASDTSVVEVGRGVVTASGRILKDSLFADGKHALVVADERSGQRPARPSTRRWWPPGSRCSTP